MKRHIILYIVLVLLLAACGPTPSLPKRGGGSDAAATQCHVFTSGWQQGLYIVNAIVNGSSLSGKIYIK